ELRLPGWCREPGARQAGCMRRRLSPAAIGHWSARRPWLAIALWLGFVVACVAALAVTGSKQRRSGAPGEWERAQNVSTSDQRSPPGAQVEYAYLHSETLRAGESAFRAAVAKVRTSMSQALVGRPPDSAPTGRTPNGGLRDGDVTAEVSADGHSVLVTA